MNIFLGMGNRVRGALNVIGSAARGMGAICKDIATAVGNRFFSGKSQADMANTDLDGRDKAVQINERDALAPNVIDDFFAEIDDK